MHCNAEISHLLEVVDESFPHIFERVDTVGFFRVS